jgi:hypothetical protein
MLPVDEWPPDDKAEMEAMLKTRLWQLRLSAVILRVPKDGLFTCGGKIKGL